MVMDGRRDFKIGISVHGMSLCGTTKQPNSPSRNESQLAK